MILNEKSVRKIIKSLLIENFILKENQIRPEVKTEWINLLNTNKKIDNSFFENEENGHKYQSKFGIYEIMNQPDHGEIFFNNVFKEVGVSNIDIVIYNIEYLYKYIYKNYIEKNNLSKEDYIKLFENIKSHIESGNKNNHNLFLDNIIKVLESCKETGVWNKNIIENEISIIHSISNIDEINKFSENDSTLRQKLRVNYPAEIIMTNINNSDTGKRKKLLNLFEKEMNNEIIKNIVTRLKNTLNYRKKQK
jgi:hypothetical protein